METFGVLPRDIITILKKTGIYSSFLVCSVLYSIFCTIPGFFKSGITSDSPFTSKVCIIVFIILNIISPVIDYIYTCKMKSIVNTVCSDFIKSSYNKYNSLSFESKNSEPAQYFRTKTFDAMNAVYQCVSWGLPEVLIIVSTTISTIYIFYVNDLGMWLFYIILLNILVYFFITASLQNTMTIDRENAETSRRENSSVITSYLPMFEVGSKSPEEMIEKETQIVLSWDESDRVWYAITAITNFTNKLVFIVFLFSPGNVLTFFLIASTIVSFSSCLQRGMSFLNAYQRSKISYGTYLKMWEGKTFESAPEKLEMQDEYWIERVDIPKRLTSDRFCIKSSDKILLKSPSGTGKTTLLNALTGKTSGVILDYGKPVNFRHQINEYFQNIKEKMPTDTITIRQHFNGEQNDDLIYQALYICKIDSWAQNVKEIDAGNRISLQKRENPITQLIKKLFKRSVAEKVTSEPKIEKNPLDIHIKNKLSGGEKTRLALATVVYKALQNPNSRWLILDEPESGLDPEVIYSILDNIFRTFSDKTIIIVSHLEGIDARHEWDHKLTIVDKVLKFL